MPYKYIGRTTDFRGKTLWEIVGNLKNYGVGRVVVRSMLERYPEPSYLRILKVQALPAPKKPTPDDVRKVNIVVEKVFRGRKFPNPVTIESASYKADYRLLSKEEEESYCKNVNNYELKILPKYMEFPPLMKELINSESKVSNNPTTSPKLEIVYRKDTTFKKYKIAEEGETPTVHVTAGLGKPVSPNLYEGLNL